METLSLIADVADGIGNLLNNIHERRIENINAEIKAEEDKYDKLIKLAGDDNLEQELLREEREASIKKLEAKRLKEEQKQAKVRKVAALADIAISTAQAIMNVWTKWAALPAVAAAFTALVVTASAAQSAAVLAAPIPQYKDGLDRAKDDHLGMINDGQHQEYIKRGDKILTTKNKNAVVNLKKNDTVYKSYDDMTNKTALMSSILNGQLINEQEFNQLLTGIKGSIEDGFKSAKINSRVIVNNKNDDYGKGLSKWN